MSRRPYYKLVNPVGPVGPVHTDLPPPATRPVRLGGGPMTSEIDRLKAGMFKALGHPLRIQIVELLTGASAAWPTSSPAPGPRPRICPSSSASCARPASSSPGGRPPPSSTGSGTPVPLHLLATAREILATSLTESRDLLADLQAKPPETIPARPSAELR